MDKNLQLASLKPSNIPFHVLVKITNGFSDDQKLGSGGFGAVYKGVLEDGQEIAVKKLHYGLGLDDKQFHNELESLMRLQHRNIVQLVGYCYEIRHIFSEYEGKQVLAGIPERVICLEYLHNGSLERHLSDESSGLDWFRRFEIIKGICEGLNYLHEGGEKCIYHLDLKPANILLDGNMVPKIADFGLSRLFDGTQTQITENIIGTRGYMPVECIVHGKISKKVDVFSLGVIIIEIMTGQQGFSRGSYMAAQDFMEQVYGNWKNRLQEEWRDSSLEYFCQQVRRCIRIAVSCVAPDWDKRPSIGDITRNLNECETPSSLENCAIEARGGAFIHNGGAGSSAVAHIRTVALQAEKDDRRTGSRRFGLLHLTMEALSAATDGFSDARRIGSGRFGSVYRGTLPSGREVAIKRAENSLARPSTSRPLRRRDREPAFLSELTILARANHKNIVNLLGCCADDDAGVRALVYEYMANGTLHDQLHGSTLLAPAVATWRGRLAVALDAARGIEYMHVYAVPPVIHRDVKSANILLDDAWTAMVSDFGLSFILDDSTTDRTHEPAGYTGGTVGYMDPEYYRLQHLTDKSDVYSFGVVLLELLSGLPVVQRYAESATPRNMLEFAVPLILADNVAAVLDPRLPAPTADEAEALCYVGYLAADCVAPTRCDRPSMTDVVDGLERALVFCSRPAALSRVGTAATPSPAPATPRTPPRAAQRRTSLLPKASRSKRVLCTYL